MRAENSHFDHQRFEDLCILSTSGELSDAEARELDQHVAFCESCRRELAENRQFVSAGMAYLASEFAAPAEAELAQPWNMNRAKRDFYRRLRAKEQEPATGTPQEKPLKAKWMAVGTAALAAAAVLLAFVYHTGERKGQDSVAGVVSENRALRGRLASLASQKSTIDGQLEARGKNIAELTAKTQQQADELARLRDIANARQTENDSLVAKGRQQSAEAESLSAERDTLAKKLDDSEKALHASEAQLAAARAERQRDLVRLTSLEAEMHTLSARLKEQDTTVTAQENFLASDRDIRELMGARDLYIADVFDVDGNGTNKPFGRVFYTKNKSLIFYAFDLDQQPRLRNASIFQAWGRHGVTDKTPLNLGIFYLDNEANKRWVLKFDDPDKLAQVDAVFVTVEPHGGSKKPSGKQLLFASIKGIANHP